MASGDTRPYVGPSDICMMYSVTDVQGIHRISEQVLANAAHALAGMIAHPPAISATNKPALGLTMFGVTTACVQARASSASRPTTTASSSTPPASAASRWKSSPTRACSPA